MVKVFIENQLLDLFGDEAIKIVSKSSDIESLGKVFNDFSMPFSVPASANNNTIFRHYYNSNIENGIDVNKRLDSYIEYHTYPFKFGAMQLNSVKLRDGVPYSYQLTFYGGATQLKETFGDHTIDGLDYDLEGDLIYDTLSGLDFTWNGPNWYSTLYNDSFMDGEIITPFIFAVDRPLQIGSADANDIAQNVGAIKADETRTAIRLRRIITGIERKFDVTFSDHIFNSAHFNNLYLWLNNRKEVDYKSQIVNLTNNFTGTDSEGRFSYESPYLKFSRNIYSYNFFEEAVYRRYDYQLDYKFNIVPSASYLDVNYKIRIVNSSNVTLIESDDWVSGTSELITSYISRPLPQGEDVNTTVTEMVRLEIITQAPIIFTVNTTVSYIRILKQAGTNPQSTNLVVKQGTTAFISLTQTFEVTPNIPQIKVIDLITNLMKMYKAVIIPITKKSFKVMPIDRYYIEGDIIDLTPYVNMREGGIDIPEIYNDIKFKYKKTKNFIGAEHRKRQDPLNDEIGYGDLVANFDIDIKKELKVELPFNNMLFQRMRYSAGATSSVGITNILLGQSTSMEDNEYTANKSDPILFYRNGMIDLVNSPIQVSFLSETKDGNGDPVIPTSTELYYSHLIGNTDDESINQVTNTLNWGAEIDPWHNMEVSESLYSNYWENWISSIYDKRQRKVTVNVQLPLGLQMKMSLDDKLIIGDARYQINEMETNLSTGDTKLILFRDLFPTSIMPSVSRTTINANCGSKYYGVDILVERDTSWSAIKVDTGDGVDWVDLVISSGTGSGQLLVYIETQLTQTAPAYFSWREMNIKITIKGVDYIIAVRQEGFVAPPA